MAVYRVSRSLLLAVIVAAFGLSGCGRKGPLDLPPGDAPPPSQLSSSGSPGSGPTMPGSFLPGSSSSAAANPQESTAMKNGFDASGVPVAPPGPKKPFILDPILQ